MLHLLHKLPDLGILAVVLIVTVALSAMAPVAGAKLFGFGDNKERDDAAFDAFKSVMSMAGVVLAFSLVQANENLRSIQTTVGKFAASVSTADRVLLRIGQPQFAQLRPVLAAFGDTVIADEWPRLAAEERSEKADALYSRLSASTRAIEPKTPREQAMFNELLRSLDEISDNRELVIEDADISLPGFFWVTVIGLMAIGSLLSMLTHPTLPRRAGIAATTAAVGLLLAFVIIVDGPFEGETSVSNRPIQTALAIDAHRK